MGVTGFRCGDVRLEVVERRALRNGAELALEPKALGVLLQLVSRPGALITRDELLSAVWGHRYVTPSTLSRAVALARRALGDEADTPHFIQTVHGVGYRYVGPVEVECGADAPAPPFGPPPRARLPASLDPLIGRDAQVREISALLRSARAVTLVGPGGIGKTRCAIEAAHDTSPDHADGIWFFDLLPAASGADWLRMLATALGLPPSCSTERVERIARRLRARRALLVLDNAERVAGEVGALALALLRATESVRILATSQVPLGFVGEHVLRLPPLEVPPESETSHAAIAAAPAVQVLLARVAATHPSFRLTPGNARTVAAICRRLDGMPLALELAATRFAMLSPEQVLERLDRRFRFLSSEHAGRDRRHRNLQALLDWSFGLLTPAQQRLLTWSCVFAGSWSLDGAIALGEALGHDAETTVDLLGELVDRSLVAVIDTPGATRYALLDTVHDYCLRRLHASGEEAAARAAHRRSVARLTGG